ncbi:MAG TPA: hypothetical protein VFS00_14795, partial [Polyangiaceae bacterium]|nr:hypothetical protein [Polyangiaceae bacterium]
AALAAALLAACGGAAADEGAFSGSTCPPDSTLTYESFGRDFMASYCTGCHASALRGVKRHGAPSDHDLDTLEAVRETEAGHIDENAAAGPERVNVAMPPADYARQPSEEERRRLGEWLACGMP